jgi:hypothetical protein
MKRRLVVLAAFLVAACGSGPTSPSPPSPTSPPSSTSGGGLPFHAARYVMDLSGDSHPCGDDIKVPQAGTTVSFILTLSADPTGWTGTTSGGGLTIHFQPSTNNSFPPFDIPMAGTASGFADDEAPVPLPGIDVQPNGTRVTFPAGTSITGGFPTAGFPFSMGSFNGTVVFSRNGVTSTCPSGAVRWTMNGP